MEAMQYNIYKNIVYVFLSIIVCVSGYGCAKDVPCKDDKIQLSFIGFSSTEIDTFIIRKYKSEDNFSTLLDTVKIYDSKQTYVVTYKATNDTIDVSILDGFTGEIKPGYDWIIYLPRISRTIKVSAIVSEQITKRYPPVFAMDVWHNCKNPIHSFQTDTLINTFPVGTTAYKLFIRK